MLSLFPLVSTLMMCEGSFPESSHMLKPPDLLDCWLFSASNWTHGGEGFDRSHTFLVQKHLSVFYHKVSSISNARTSCWSGSWVKEPSAKSTSQNVPTSARTVTRCWSPSKWVNLHRCYVVSFPVNICSSSETNSVVAAHFCRSAGKRKTEMDRNKMRKRYI